MPIIYGALLVAIGSLTLAFAITNIDIVDKVLSISLAVSLFLIGALNIAVALIVHTSDFFSSSILFGSLAVAFGVILTVNQDLIGSFIVYLLGSFMICLGAVCLLKAVLFIKYKQNLGWIIFHFAVATIAIALGILVICFRNESKVALYVVIGATIILAGAGEVIIAIKNFIQAKRGANKVVDQPYEQIEEKNDVDA